MSNSKRHCSAGAGGFEGSGGVGGGRLDEVHALDVVRFTAARVDEVRAVQQQLVQNEGRSGGGRARVHQTLPKHLRRRAASYNVHRLPAHLRGWAKKQIAMDPGNEQTRAQRRRSRKKTPTGDHDARQAKTRWLETHVWHAKRMHMMPLWGVRLAMHTSDKGVRFGYRSAARACTLYDASYLDVVEVSGPEGALALLLRALCIAPSDGPSAGAAMYRDGARAGNALLCHAEAHVGERPRRAVCPVRFLWRPFENDVPEGGGAGASATRQRVVWLWIHPASKMEALAALGNEAAAHDTVTVQPLDGQVLTFELTGPRSHAIAAAVIRPRSSTGKAGDVWGLLSSLSSTRALPAGAAFAMDAQDPRTFSAHRRRATDRHPSAGDAGHERGLDALLSAWPGHLAQCKLWDDEQSETPHTHRCVPTPQLLTPPYLAGAQMRQAESDATVNTRRAATLLKQAPPPLGSRPSHARCRDGAPRFEAVRIRC